MISIVFRLFCALCCFWIYWNLRSFDVELFFLFLSTLSQFLSSSGRQIRKLSRKTLESFEISRFFTRNFSSALLRCRIILTKNLAHSTFDHGASQQPSMEKIYMKIELILCCSEFLMCRENIDVNASISDAEVEKVQHVLQQRWWLEKLRGALNELLKQFNDAKNKQLWKVLTAMKQLENFMKFNSIKNKSL